MANPTGVYSASLAELLTRLNFQKGTGKILSGFKVVDYPLVEIDGERDVPVVRVYVPDFSEVYRVKNPTVCSFKVKVTVATKREDGVAKLMEAVEKVLDAIDMKPDNTNTVDPFLNGTLRAPFSVATENGMAHTVSITCPMVLTFMPRKNPTRGSRR